MLSPPIGGQHSYAPVASGSKPNLIEKLKHPKKLKAERHIGITSECRSGTASSCELFGMLKALAAGGNDVEDSAEVDSDEVDDGLLAFGAGREDQGPVTPTSTLPMPRAESSTTIRPDLRASETVKQEPLERWMDETVGRAMSHSEVSSARFAGELDLWAC